MEHLTTSYMTKQLNSALNRYTLNFDMKDLKHLRSLAGHHCGLDDSNLRKDAFNDFKKIALNNGVDINWLMNADTILN